MSPSMIGQVSFSMKSLHWDFSHSFFYRLHVFLFAPTCCLRIFYSKHIVSHFHSLTNLPFLCLLIMLQVLTLLQFYSLPLSLPVEFSKQIAQNAASFLENNPASAPRRTMGGDDCLFLEQPQFSYAKTVEKLSPSCLKVARYSLKYRLL